MQIDTISAKKGADDEIRILTANISRVRQKRLRRTMDRQPWHTFRVTYEGYKRKD